MAATAAMTHRHIVSATLRHLSDMKYKDRRQRGPDQPVELLEFRPTLIPCILVNKLWADEGTSILWKRYPHLPAFKAMDQERRQYYATKVHHVFSLGPHPDHLGTLDYLDDLTWPNLRSLELEIDFARHGGKFHSMLHPGLEHLELSGFQSRGAAHFNEVVLPSLFSACRTLKTVRFGPGLFPDDDPVHASCLYDHLDSISSIRSVEVKSAGFIGVDSLFMRLSQRAGLEGLEIDLEPGLALLHQLESLNAFQSPFASLKRLNVMCYPEIALALPTHFSLIEELQFDLCRIPDSLLHGADDGILNDLIDRLSLCSRLRTLKVGIGALAIDFPSFDAFPKLSGAAIVALGNGCCALEEITLFASDPSAIDASDITSEDFNAFCTSLPCLRNLNLKFHPPTALAIEATGLQSLGEHCQELEVLRLKVPFQLPSLPVPNAIPQISVSAPVAEGETFPEATLPSPNGDMSSSHFTFCDPSPNHASSAPLFAFFPKLMHLALARPKTVLATFDDSFTASSASYSEVIDPDLEEDLVRSWAHVLLTHFPHLEILEAWGDWTGQDNESQNYFLPTEEILATTWEFLSGAEQDLWNDLDEEGDSWQTIETRDDWDAASYLNEYIPNDSMLNPEYVEPDGIVTPGRTVEEGELFGRVDIKLSPQVPHDILRSEESFERPSPLVLPTAEFNNMKIS